MERLSQLANKSTNYSFLENLDGNFLDIISKLRVYGEINPSGELYLQQNFGISYLSDCIIIKMNQDLEKDKD